MTADLSKMKDQQYLDMVKNQISSNQISLQPYKQKPQFIEIAAVNTDAFLVKKMIEIC